MANITRLNFSTSILKKNLTFFREYSNATIPKRIKRNNLTILKELASTVKTDYGGPHFQFIDDPYLIPITNIDKKVATLSAESGRSAARYVMQEYPKLFAYDTSFPVIKDFCPVMERTPKEDILEELKELIGLLRPMEAFAAYKKALDETGTPIPRVLLDDLLDLLCFTNGEAPSTPQPPNVRHHMADLEDGNEDVPKMTEWSSEGPAETVFQRLEDPSLRNLSSIIKGRCKFKAYDQAFEEYTKIMENKTRIDTHAHNAILSISPHIKNTHEEIWKFINDVFILMQETQVRPTVETFNSALSSFVESHLQSADYVSIEAVQTKFNYALILVAEMVSCKIHPTLTTWWYLLEIAYPNYKTRGSVINNIIEYVSCNEVRPYQDTDFEFFNSAMSKCLKNIRSVEAAKKLHAVIVDNSLEFMLGSSINMSTYYTSYLTALLQYDSMATAMEEYDKLIPNFYTPTYKLMSAIFRAVEHHYAYEYIPKLWDDMVTFRYLRRSDMVSSVLTLMAKAPKDANMEEAYVRIADSIFAQYLQDASTTAVNKTLDLTGSQASDVMKIFLNAEQYEKAWTVFEKFLERSKMSSGLLNEEPLVLLCQHYIQENHFERTSAMLKLMAEYGLACADSLVDAACNDMIINETEKIQLRNLLIE